MAGTPELPAGATVGENSFYPNGYDPNTDEFGRTPCPPAASGVPGPPVYGQSSQPGPNAVGNLQREEYRRQILEELGGEGVDVELSEQNLDHALKRALQLWNKHRPLLAWFPFDVPTSQTLPITFFKRGCPQADAQGNPYGFVQRVLDVEFSDRDRRALGAGSGVLSSTYLRWGYQGPRLFFELHVAERNYERLTGTRPDWRWDAGSRVLYLMSPARNTRAMVLTSRRRQLDEIPPDHEHDFVTVAVGYAKRTAARILGSRGAIPGPAGAIDTDASELRSEGKEEINEIREKLEAAQSSVPPPRYIG